MCSPWPQCLRSRIVHTSRYSGQPLTDYLFRHTSTVSFWIMHVSGTLAHSQVEVYKGRPSLSCFNPMNVPLFWSRLFSLEACPFAAVLWHHVLYPIHPPSHRMHSLSNQGISSISTSGLCKPWHGRESRRRFEYSIFESG